MTTKPFTHGAGFRICGVIERKFVNPAGTFAALTLSCKIDGKTRKLDLKAFRNLVAEVDELGVGQTVEVTGGVESECLKDKAKNPVIVDGREKWVPSLTIRNIKVEAHAPAVFDEKDVPISGAPKSAAPANLDDDWDKKDAADDF